MALTLASPARAEPQGGQVVGGQATITQGGGVTTVDQFSDRALIDWRRFSLDANETARFRQPGSESIALNRVRGSDPSVILGQLQANGQVWLVNPNGVLFGPGARIDVGGILATTADIRNEDFLAGRFDFSIPSPDRRATVINEGAITLGETGLAALVAPHVRNDGVIVGTLGEVVLAGAPTFSLDLHGDGLIRFATAAPVTDALVQGPLVANGGRIGVDGGRVLLTAEAAEGVVDQVINAGGVIEARSFTLREGAIVLDGGANGQVAVSGTLSVAGAEPGAQGGSIDVLGDRLLLAADSLLDASGAAGGGEVHVGGDRRGQGERRRASETVVEAGSRIAADATVRGLGGEVVLWADRRLAFAGEVSARGGPEGGDGGIVETSSPSALTATGRVDVGAPRGRPGDWLVDPVHVVITADGSAVPPILAGDPPVDGTAVVSAAALAAASGNIVIEATRTIKVFAPISTTGSLSLYAGVGVVIGAPVATTGEVSIRTRDIRTTGDAVITAGRLTLDSIAKPDGVPTGPDFNSFSATIATDVDRLAIGRAGSGDPLFREVSVVNRGGLAIDGVGAQGSVVVRADGPVSIDGPISAGGSGATLVLVGERITNQAGPQALDPGSGRFIVYSTDPSLDARGGLAGSELFGRTFASSPPADIPGAGNTFVYAGQTSPVADPGLDDQVREIATQGPLFTPVESVSQLTQAIAPPSFSSDIAVAPPPQPGGGSGDLLFSNDGNRELWN